MEIKVKFDPIVNNYLKSKYPNGIKYDLSDNLTLFVYSLLVVPKPGEITKDDPDGVSILLSKLFLDSGRVFIPEYLKADIPKYVLNHIEHEMFQELVLLIQNNRHKRFKGINLLIHKFMIRHNIDGCSDIDRFKKAFYRYRKKFEINFPASVPNCPLEIS
jgi:hypothetical protein